MYFFDYTLSGLRYCYVAVITGLHPVLMIALLRSLLSAS